MTATRSKYAIKKRWPNAKFGASRAFIPCDGYGIKIPYTERGVVETDQEIRMLFYDYYIDQYYYDILPKGIEEFEDGYKVELLKPVTGKLFREITGLGLREACWAFQSETSEKKFWENEWWYNVKQLFDEYRLPSTDIRPSNLGTDGENIKVLDFVFEKKMYHKEIMTKRTRNIYGYAY